MEANGGESSRILREIENLKSAKSEIERRISDLEAQLRDVDEKDETKTNSTRSCPPLSNGDSGFGHGLDTSTRGQVEREEESPNKRKCRTWVLESLEEDKRYCKQEWRRVGPVRHCGVFSDAQCVHPRATFA
ncbi:hypothetical protein CsSME_00030917 [Camellia sinensis var. sinensis]